MSVKLQRDSSVSMELAEAYVTDLLKAAGLAYLRGEDCQGNNTIAQQRNGIYVAITYNDEQFVAYVMRQNKEDE